MQQTTVNDIFDVAKMPLYIVSVLKQELYISSEWLLEPFTQISNSLRTEARVSFGDIKKLL